MNLQKLNEKLLQKFLDSTKSIKNKRIVEHSLNDMLQVILVILVIIGVVCTINFSGNLLHYIRVSSLRVHRNVSCRQSVSP